VGGNLVRSKGIPAKIPIKTINKLKAKVQNNRTSPLAKDKRADKDKLGDADGIEINKLVKKSTLWAYHGLSIKVPHVLFLLLSRVVNFFQLEN